MSLPCQNYLPENPIIYYSTYQPTSDRPRDVVAQEHLLGRSLLLHGLRELYQLWMNESTLEKEINTDSNGKPYLKNYPEIHFNITHCDGLVACAFGPDVIGVDAEFPGYFAEVLIKKALSKNEQRCLEEHSLDANLRNEFFYRFWTLKESYVKMTGTGVDVPLTEFDFSFVGTSEPYKIICSDSSAYCFQRKLSGGHIISVCTKASPTEANRIRPCLFQISGL